MKSLIMPLLNLITTDAWAGHSSELWLAHAGIDAFVALFARKLLELEQPEDARLDLLDQEHLLDEPAIILPGQDVEHIAVHV